MSENVNQENKQEQENTDTPETQPQQEPSPETAEETFTVTRDQMEKMEQLAKMVSDASDKYLRLAAEYDNYRKRTAKEKESIYADAKADALTAFLPVYDNLERALKQETADEALKKGVEMTMTQLREILTKLGISEIPALGESFDPNLHNAVMHVEDEAAGENTIVDVFQAGFKLGDKVIRFAMVKVAN